MENFSELNLVPALQKAIAELGFEKPSTIQAQALPILLGEDTDFIGLAATGTGKTAAFSLPMLSRIDPDVRSVQAIILCPTRELCMQVSGQVNLLGKYLGITSLPIYGGAGYGEQLSGLRRGIPVVVGTPGRVIDHIERGTLKLDQVRIVVLDEADEMISMGFKEDMETILATVPKETSHTWLFSATMSPVIRRVADEFLVEPKMVQINRSEMLPSTVEQIYFMTHEANKPEVLCKLIDQADEFYGLVFCQTKQLVTTLTRYLSDRGYKADCLHGDMSQAARETAMKSFRDGRTKVMVCTDVAARGLDVKDVTHVINYSLPRELDNYVHRIGRTARSGKKGVAMSLVTPSHRGILRQIERLTKTTMVEGVVPSRREIGLKKIAQMLPQFKEAPLFQKAVELMDDSWKETLAGMSAEEVAARFMCLQFPWVFAEKQPMKMQMSTEGRDERRDRPGRREGKFGRSGGYDRGERSERSDRYERPRRFEGGEDTERPRRSAEFEERSEGPKRFERSERSEVSERPARSERTERPSRFSSEGGRSSYVGRREQSESSEKSERFARPTRYDRESRSESSERPARADRSERPQRSSFGRPSSRFEKSASGIGPGKAQSRGPAKGGSIYKEGNVKKARSKRWAAENEF